MYAEWSVPGRPNRMRTTIVPPAQRGLVQPLGGERVVLDGVVQPGGRDLLLVTGARPYPLRDRLEVFGVRPSGLVGLPLVRGAGDGLYFGQGQGGSGGLGHVSRFLASAAAGNVCP